jgi:hypothetical protein
MNLSDATLSVLAALRAHAESAEIVSLDGSRWRSVYLDNARPSDMNDKSFRAHLAVLSRAGFYSPFDGYAFGDVKMPPLDTRAVGGLVNF